MEPDKISSFDITLIDLENPNLSFSLCLTTNESIQKVRSYIEEEDEWKGINFKFMNGSSPLLKSSEKEKIISDIISNNKLYIRSGKK